MNLILKNASYLFVSNAGIRLITALVSILIARYLGAEDFGILSIAMAFASVAAYFTDLGLSQTFIREATKDKKVDLPNLVGSHIKIRAIFVISVSILLFILVELLYDDPFLKQIIYFTVYPSIIGASMQGVGVVFFQATQKMQYTAFINAFAGLVTAATLVIGLLAKWPLTIIAPIYGCSSLIGGALGVYLLTKHTKIQFGWDKNLLFGLWSFSFGGLLILALPQVPIIVLEKVTSMEEVGYFSAAYRIPSILYQIPGVIAAAFYPVLFNYNSKGEHELQLKMSILEGKLMTMLGICMTLPFLLYSDFWVGIIFGKGWEGVSPLLTILSIMIILQSINYPLADSLTTRGYQTKRTLVMLIGVIYAVAGYYFLGSVYQAQGGAINVLIIELILMLGFTLLGKRVGVAILFKSTYRNVMSLLISIGLYFLLRDYLHPVIGIGLFLLLFIILALLLDSKIRQYILENVGKVIKGRSK
ncbi:flippase [Ferdinandcohnia sp. Marseille-Q9671]